MRVFCCHASDDAEIVCAVHQALLSDGYRPWLDKVDLLPGQTWEHEVRSAIRSSAAVLVFLSNRSVRKEGFVQKELRQALDIAAEKPDGTIYIVPIQLDDCVIPQSLASYHVVDLREPDAYAKLLVSLERRQTALSPDSAGATSALLPVRYEEHDAKNQWMVYEVAFLWCGFEPPSPVHHFTLMTPRVEQAKARLHREITAGRLRAAKEVVDGRGLTRWLDRDVLCAFAERLGERPAFLFPTERGK